MKKIKIFMIFIMVIYFNDIIIYILSHITFRVSLLKNYKKVNNTPSLRKFLLNKLYFIKSAYVKNKLFNKLIF